MRADGKEPMVVSFSGGAVISVPVRLSSAELLR